MTAENRTPRLHRLARIYVRSPIYFVTTCTANRRHILATEAIHESFLHFAEEGPEHGAWIGAYVLMPDHVHAFVAIDDQKISLSEWMKSLKNALSKTMPLQKDSSTTLAENVFRSRASRRRLLHGEMALRARESCTRWLRATMARLAVPRRNIRPAVSIRELNSAVIDALSYRCKTHAAITAHRTSATRSKALVARSDSHARNRKMRGQIWPDWPHTEPSSRRHQVAATRRSPY